VFLDEIGELPMSVQPKLLRAVESRTIRRVGEAAHHPVDVRFVCATHRDLLRMVNDGEFREDLYFRLSVIPIIVPPLRERPDDIPALVAKFLPPSQPQAIGADVMQELVRRPWRGNVRELRNFVERAIALGPSRALEMMNGETSPTPDAPVVEATSFEQPFTAFREQWRDKGDRQYLEHLLAAHGNNVSLVAKAAGVDRTYIYRLMRRLGM
jgi:transcriptional regulator with PAS, ATPase and Fis domain